MPLPNFVPELHEKFDLEAWPKFVIRRGGTPWESGVLYLRHDRPDHAAAVNTDGTLAWERTGHGYDFDTLQKYVRGYRRQVSPLYICALLMHVNGV